MNDAKLLFLDEPISGLDPVTTREIHDILIGQRKGATVFLTNHNMFEAESIRDYVILLHKGSIIEQGRPTDICRKYNHLNKLHITLTDDTKLTDQTEAGKDFVFPLIQKMVVILVVQIEGALV